MYLYAIADKQTGQFLYVPKYGFVRMYRKLNRACLFLERDKARTYLRILRKGEVLTSQKAWRRPVRLVRLRVYPESAEWSSESVSMSKERRAKVRDIMGKLDRRIGE